MKRSGKSRRKWRREEESQSAIKGEEGKEVELLRNGSENEK